MRLCICLENMCAAKPASPAGEVVPAVGVDFSALAAGAAPGAVSDQGMGTLLGDPVLWLCGFVMFFYGPLEACLAEPLLILPGEDRQTYEGVARELWATFAPANILEGFAATDFIQTQWRLDRVLPPADAPAAGPVT